MSFGAYWSDTEKKLSRLSSRIWFKKLLFGMCHGLPWYVPQMCMNVRNPVFHEPKNDVTSKRLILRFRFNNQPWWLGR